MTVRGRHQNTAEHRSRERATSDVNRDMEELGSVDELPSYNHPPGHRDLPGPSKV